MHYVIYQAQKSHIKFGHLLQTARQQVQKWVWHNHIAWKANILLMYNFFFS